MHKTHTHVLCFKQGCLITTKKVILVVLYDDLQKSWSLERLPCRQAVTEQSVQR